MLKVKRPFGFLITLLIPVLFVACGYQPMSRMYDLPGLKGGEPLPLYMPIWNNNTNEFGLESEVYNTVANWLQGSEYILLKKKGAEAKYILNGTIRSIDLSSSLGTVRLTVSYSLQDAVNGKTIWPETRYIFSKSYLITADALSTNSERQKALNEISDDLGEKIYVRFLNTMVELRKKQAATQTEPREETSPEKTGSE